MPFTLIESYPQSAAQIRAAIAQRLRQARLEAEHSQEWVAEVLGVHRNTIGQIERAEVGVRAEDLVLLAEVYAVRVRWLIEGV